MKRLFLLLLTIACITMCYADVSVWDGKSKSIGFYNDSEVADTLHLASASDFVGFVHKVTDQNELMMGRVVVLDTDIDLGSHPIDQIGKEYYSYLDGQVYNFFSGTFDGRGHTISNIQSSGGLFAGLGENAKIINLYISGVMEHLAPIDSGDCVGALVDKMLPGSTVSSCISNLAMTIRRYGETYSPYLEYGGLVGSCNGGTIEYCEVGMGSGMEISVSDNNSSSINKVRALIAGGVVGRLSGKSTIKATSSSVPMSVNFKGDYVLLGGICGHISSYSSDVTISNCLVNKGISLTTKNKGEKCIGGIVGKAYETATVKSCLVIAKGNMVCEALDTSIDAICGKYTKGINISDCYFQSGIIDNPIGQNGVSPVTEEKLKECDGLKGLSSDYWIFPDSDIYPQLRCLPDHIYMPNPSYSFNVGDTYFPEASVYPEWAYKFLTVSSPDPTLAKVCEDGSIKFLKNGMIPVSATTVNGLIATCYVEVGQPLTNILLDQSEVTIDKGTSLKLNVAVEPDNNYDISSFKWSSSSEDIATVDQNGNITGISPGQATITVDSGTGISASCIVNVIFTNGDIFIKGNFQYHVISGNERTVSMTCYSGDDSFVIIPDSVDYRYPSGGYDFFKVTAIGGISKPAFENSDLLLSVRLPEGLTAILNNAFRNCSNLKSIDLPNSIIQIKESAFANCKALESIELPSELKYIFPYTFYGCESLESIVIPNKVETISLGAFQDCSNLKLIELGENVSKIGDLAFDGCSLIKAILSRPIEPPTISIYINPSFSKIGGYLYVPKKSSGKYLNSNWDVVFFGDIIGTDFIKKITLDQTEVILKPKESIYLNAHVYPTPVLANLKWSSSNESIVTVDEFGYITAQNVGEATVTLLWVNTGLSVSCNVTVSNPATGITLDLESVDMNVGQTLMLTATVDPENAYDKTVIWTSSDNGVATVSNDGTVTAISEGNATITATTVNGLSASCEIFVTQLAEAILISPESVEANIGQTVQLHATVLPENTSNPAIVWSSSNEDIAMVSSKGLVAIVAEGECEIFAETTDGSNLRAVCHISATSGIESIFADGNKKHDIYSATGILIKKGASLDDYNDLPQGIYIIDNQKIYKKH